MGTTSLSFHAQVSEWCRQTEERMNAVLRESSKDLAGKMQLPVGAGGRMPVDTGTLRASLRASKTAMPKIEAGRTSNGNAVNYDASEIMLVIGSLKVGETLYLGYTARYAAFVEFGTSKMAPRAFVATAALEWPQIVANAAARLKGQVNDE